MKNINFALIGFGGIAKTHALASFDANLRFDLPYSLNLVNVVTRSPKEIKLLNVKNSLSIDEVLEDENIDFISICTPNDSHREIVEKAAAFGKAIYCEKPLSSNYEEALKMAEIVKEKKVKNAVALMYRFLPGVRMLKSEIEKGTIGEIIDFKIKTYHKSYLSEKKKGSWRTLKSSGGGALLDLGVHLIDLVQFTIGDIKEVESKTKIHFKDRSFVDEIAYCEFILENNIQGSLEVSRVFAERDQSDMFEIYGTKGSIKVYFKRPYEIEVYDYSSNCTNILKPSGNSEILKYYAGERSSLGFFQNAHTSSLINFANSIYHNSDIGIAADFEDALKSQRVIDMAYKNIR